MNTQLDPILVALMIGAHAGTTWEFAGMESVDIDAEIERAIKYMLDGSTEEMLEKLRPVAAYLRKHFGLPPLRQFPFEVPEEPEADRIERIEEASAYWQERIRETREALNREGAFLNKLRAGEQELKDLPGVVSFARGDGTLIVYVRTKKDGDALPKEAGGLPVEVQPWARGSWEEVRTDGGQAQISLSLNPGVDIPWCKVEMQALTGVNEVHQVFPWHADDGLQRMFVLNVDAGFKTEILAALRDASYVQDAAIVGRRGITPRG